MISTYVSESLPVMEGEVVHRFKVFLLSFQLLALPLQTLQFHLDVQQVTLHASDLLPVKPLQLLHCLPVLNLELPPNLLVVVGHLFLPLLQHFPQPSQAVFRLFGRPPVALVHLAVKVLDGPVAVLGTVSVGVRWLPRASLAEVLLALQAVVLVPEVVLLAEGKRVAPARRLKHVRGSHPLHLLLLVDRRGRVDDARTSLAVVLLLCPAIHAGPLPAALRAVWRSAYDLAVLLHHEAALVADAVLAVASEEEVVVEGKGSLVVLEKETVCVGES